MWCYEVNITIFHQPASLILHRWVYELLLLKGISRHQTNADGGQIDVDEHWCTSDVNVSLTYFENVGKRRAPHFQVDQPKGFLQFFKFYNPWDQTSTDVRQTERDVRQTLTGIRQSLTDVRLTNVHQMWTSLLLIYERQSYIHLKSVRRASDVRCFWSLI